ncbi:MAG: 1,2-phenylacetyl-CoA epoxidase subunit PaaC [Ignavibacteria bacterium]
MEYTEKQIKVIKELLFKMADDQLIIGHRNSEWTGLGPILEEDIAFSSIAQDKIGQSLAIYNMLYKLGEAEPDALGFLRKSEEFRCCHLVEYPTGEYNFSLIRNFLYNHAEHERFIMLSDSAFEPISKLAKKVKGEIKYHIMHADTWVIQLGNANEDSRILLQKSINESFNLALGIFEPGDNENELAEMKVFEGENALQKRWLESIKQVLNKTPFQLPSENLWKPVYGGRKGIHTEYLQPLIDEMSEVFNIDSKAEW